MTKKNATSSTKLWSSIAGLALLLLVIAALNMIAKNLKIRKDLTEEQLYTLSAGTKNTLKNLDKEVVLKFFFSKSLTETPVFLRDFAGRVEDLLDEYALASGGKVLVEKYDPRPDTDDEDAATRFGIAGQQTGLVGPFLYLGVAAICGNTEASLPVIDPRTENLLEYNLTRLIYHVTNPEKPTIGVLSSIPVLGTKPSPYPMQGQQQLQPWMAFKNLMQDFKVTEVSPDSTAINQDISALIVVHPKDLPKTTLLAIDQYLLSGGRLLILLDPLCAIEREISGQSASPFNRQPTSSQIRKLTDAWGVTYDETKLAADMSAATKLRTGAGEINESPIWLSLRGNHINKDDITTSKLESLMMPFAGSFRVASTSNLTVTSLIKTSANAAEVSAFTAQFNMDAVRREFKRGEIPLDLAIRITGTFNTAFPNGVKMDTPKDDPDDETKQKGPAEIIKPSIKEGSGTVILIADVDMFYDRNCMEQLNFFGFQGFQPINDNLAFFHNAVEQLTGSQELIGLRSRGSFNRPFERVLRIEENARSDWREREEQLQASLQQTQEKLSELQTQKDPNQRMILSPAQKEAIENFKKEENRIRAELRKVQKNLRKDVDTLGWKLKAVNIACMPLLVILVGIAYGISRKMRI